MYETTPYFYCSCPALIHYEDEPLYLAHLEFATLAGILVIGEGEAERVTEQPTQGKLF